MLCVIHNYYRLTTKYTRKQNGNGISPCFLRDGVHADFFFLLQLSISSTSSPLAARYTLVCIGSPFRGACPGPLARVPLPPSPLDFPESQIAVPQLECNFSDLIHCRLERVNMFSSSLQMSSSSTSNSWPSNRLMGEKEEEEEGGRGERQTRQGRARLGLILD